MRLRQVEQFVRIVEEGSLGKAARALRISQPALTKSLHALERDVRASLLDRSHRGVKPTPFGDCLYRHGKRVEAELKRAIIEIEEMRGARTGAVSIGAIPAAARSFLPTAILHLAQNRPGITVSVAEMNNAELIRAFTKGDFDFVVAILDQEELDDTFVTKMLYHDELAVVVRPGHPLTQRRMVAPADLLAYPWIYPRPATARRQRIDDFFAAASLAPPNAMVEGSSTSFKLAILLQSDLVTVMPRDLLASDESAKQLTALKLTGPSLRRRVGIIHRGQANVSPSAAIVIKEIEDARRVSGRS